MELIRITLLLLAALARARASLSAQDKGAAKAGLYKKFYKNAITLATSVLDSIDASGKTEDPSGVSNVIKAFQMSGEIFNDDATADIQFIAEVGFFEMLVLLLDHPFETLRYNTCLFLRTSLLADEEQGKFKRDLADQLFERGIVARVLELASSSSVSEKAMASFSLVDIVYLASDYHVPKLVHDGANDVVCNAIRTVDDDTGGADLMVKALETAKKLDYKEVAARKLEDYSRDAAGGGSDAAQLAQIAQLNQMMAGMGMGGMGEMPALPGSTGGQDETGPHELSIHAQLCDATENFCRMFPCAGDQAELGAPEDAAAQAERARRAEAELREAVARTRAEERAQHDARLAEQERGHAAAMEKELAELKRAHAEALEKGREERDAAIKKAVEEARRDEL